MNCSNLNLFFPFSFFLLTACPSPDWVLFKNSCFRKLTEELNWFDAQQHCASINSDLTSIHSEDENIFVHQKVIPGSSRLWIGLYNYNITGHSYKWVDGTSVSFTKWNENEPNNRGPFNNENCTEFNSKGKWNDLNCFGYNLSYVCGKKMNP